MWYKTHEISRCKCPCRTETYLWHIVVPPLTLLFLQFDGDASDRPSLDAFHQMGDIPAKAKFNSIMRPSSWGSTPVQMHQIEQHSSLLCDMHLVHCPWYSTLTDEAVNLFPSDDGLKCLALLETINSCKPRLQNILHISGSHPGIHETQWWSQMYLF